jgi:uncharacterized protein YjbI with pentapeptide repeats
MTQTNLQGANLTNTMLGSQEFSKGRLKQCHLIFEDINMIEADFTEARRDRAQIRQRSKIASGVNPTTGITTRDSRECNWAQISQLNGKNDTLAETLLGVGYRSGNSNWTRQNSSSCLWNR